MRIHSYIRPFFAATLLLLFTLQAGLGLYLHTAFHQPTSIVQTSPVQKANLASPSENTGFSCSCVDDFLVPFYTAEPSLLPQPSYIFFIQPQADYYNFLPHSLKIFRSLRAPPIAVS